jgi:hypothetical protein
MADEAILRTRFSDPVDFTCADGTAIPKGTLLSLTGDRVVSIASANSDVMGVCARDKIADDGRVTTPVFIDGIFDMTDSGAGVTRGEAVAAAGSNEVKTAVAGDVGMETLGFALETASADEVFQVLLKAGCNNNAYS